MPDTDPLRVVTTSWDDGDPQDLRIAELLVGRGLSGTFYIPVIGYDGRPTLEGAQLKELASAGLEIGAHGLSHHTLPKFHGKELAREVNIPKRRLQDLLGRDVRMFSYPKGRRNSRVIKSLQQAGYAGSRTTRMLACDLHFAPFEMPTTLHAFPHTRLDYVKNLGRAGAITDAFRYARRFTLAGQWMTLGKALFDEVLQRGGVWHLFGHSWEIDRLGLWRDLCTVLDYVSGRNNVLYISNGELLNLSCRPAELERRGLRADAGLL